jgi:hypothetical protein
VLLVVPAAESLRTPLQATPFKSAFHPLTFYHSPRHTARQKAVI